MSDEWDISDDEIDEWLDEWEEVDRAAAAYLDEYLPHIADDPGPGLGPAVSALREGVSAGRPPYDYFVHALGWSTAPADDDAVWLDALAATVSPPKDPQTDPESQSYLMALQHADWLGIVLGLVRGGAGTQLTAEQAQRDVEALEDVEGEIEDPEGHLSVLSMAILTLTPLWQALHVLDDDERLTTLGRWGLPRALRVVWTPPGSDEAGTAGP